MRKKLGNILKYSLSFALAGLFVWFACRGLDWREFVEGLKTTRWGWMALFFIAAYLAVVLRTLRWNQLLHPFDDDIHYGRVFDATNIGAMASIVIPGSGELVRCGMVTTGKVPFQTAFGTMVVERAWDFFAIFLMMVLALVFGWNRFGGFFVDNIWHIRRYRNRSRLLSKMNDFLEGLVSGLASFAKIKNKLPFLIYTVGIWVMYTLMCYVIMKAMPDLSHLTFADAVFISAIGNIATLVPVPGGIGAYHYVLRLSMTTLYGTTGEMGLLYATLCHELHALVVIVLGVWSYVMRVVILKGRNASGKN